MIENMLTIVGRTLIAIASMYFLTKLLGKKQLSEITLFGYISGISIGNIAAYIALENDDLWLLGIVSLSIWGLVTIILERITLKSKKLRSYIDSRRRHLINNGVVLKEAMAKENMTAEELLEQLRNKDVHRIADIETASIEANGQLSVLLKAEHTPLTPAMLGIRVEKEKEPITLIIDGSLELETMRSNGIDQNWLKKHLDQVNVQIQDVFIAQYMPNKEITIHTLDHRTLVVDLQGESGSQNGLSIAQLEQLKKGLLQAIALLEQQTKKNS